MRTLARVTALATVFMASPAFAHVGLGDHGGLGHGFLHPILGADHVLAMVAVGILAAQLGGRAMWLVPAAFVGMMALGGGLGFAGLDVPFIEMGIAASVLALGALIAFDARLPTALAMAVVGLFAIFHGHAHGTELPAGSAPLAFALGFVLATALLHATGVALGLLSDRIAGGHRWVSAAGGAVAVAGAALISLS